MTDQDIVQLGPAFASFLRRFRSCFLQDRTARHFDNTCRGLLSALPRKSVEPMALYRWFLSLSAVFILASTALVFGGEPDEGTQATRIADLIQQLGDDDFARRESASKVLDLIGEPALPLLRRAALSDDPEVRQRAEKLICALKLRADATKVTVELYFSAEHAPEAIEADTRAELTYVTSINKAKAGEVSYNAQRLLADIEVVSVKREERPGDLEKAVLVRLLVTKEQAATIERFQVRTAGDPSPKQDMTRWPMRLEPARPAKE